MRAPSIITLIVIILICFMFLLNIYNEDLTNKINNKKETINIDYYTKRIEYIKNIINILFIITFSLSIVGTSIFIIILKNSLGNKFSIYNFILGSRDQECFSKEIYTTFKKNPLFFEWNKQIIKYNNNKKKFMSNKMEKRMQALK